LKFISKYLSNKFEVLTPAGFKSFCGVGKTVKYKVYKIYTSRNILSCADDHLVITNKGAVYCKDLKIDDLVKTKNGFEKVVSIKISDSYENMYDLLDVKDNIYYTNGIASHNSTIYEVAVVHYIIFNPQKNVAILADKKPTAKKIFNGIRRAYENLPMWLQQGAVKFNEDLIVLENGSSCACYGTSASSIRGDAVNWLIVDECLSGDSIITVKDEETGEVKQISLKQLHEE